MASRSQSVSSAPRRSSRIAARRDSISGMPLDVLIHIMRYLSPTDLVKMTHVSSRMRAVSETAIKQVRCVSTADAVDERIAKLIAQFMPNIRRIYLYYVNFNSNAVDALSEYSHRLTHLTLRHCIEFYDTPRWLFTKSPNLMYLDVSLNTNHFNGKSLEYLPPTLVHLNFLGCWDVYFSHLVNMKALPNLLSLAMDVISLQSYEVNLLLRRMPKLRCLKINSAFIRREQIMFTDFSHNLDLEILSITDNNYIRSESFNSLQDCKKLRSLIVTANPYLCQSSLSTDLRAVAGCKALRVLYLSKRTMFTLTDVLHVVKSCGVKYVHLASHILFPHAVLEQRIQGIPSLQGCFRVNKVFKGSDFLLAGERYLADEQEYITESVTASNTTGMRRHRTESGNACTDYVARQAALAQSSAAHGGDFFAVLEFGAL